MYVSHSKVRLIYTLLSKRGIERDNRAVVCRSVCCLSRGYVRFQVHVMRPVKYLGKPGNS